ncbi:ABC transporter permease [Luedemannella helvata]|uniref:ABC-2 type transport system permease protein n=1 Tax=Luedemannella helvata TaxID=349315 RepID=A0ABN2L2L4_9ACTN
MNWTIASITLRGLFGRRRFLLLLPLPLLVIGLAVLCRALGADPETWGEPVLVGLGLSVTLPLIALIIGTGVLGAEIDDGTITHILAKPLPRAEIILSKLLVAIVVTAVTVAPAFAVAGLITGTTSVGVGLAVGALVGSAAYGGLFVAMSILTRRPVLLGLLYVLLWEGILSNALEGTRILSISQYVATVADRFSDSPILGSTVGLPAALIMSGVFLVGGTLLAVNRLRSFSVAGETS